MASLNTWKVLEPDSYYRGFIEKEKRPDGRSWMESRLITLRVGSINTADGSATVRFGNTTLVCGIKAEISTPDLRRPDEGFLVPNVELYPCCSPDVKAGPPGEKAMITTKFIHNILEKSSLLDLKTLCIVPNKIAWCLYCDVICLDYDGNLVDSALLSIISALGDVKLPKVTFDEETEKILVSPEKTEALILKNKPTATTFTIYNSEIQLLDPTAEDESEGSGEVTMVLQEDGTVCLSHKSGGHVLSPETMKSFLNISKKQSAQINKIMNGIQQKPTSMRFR